MGQNEWEEELPPLEASSSSQKGAVGDFEESNTAFKEIQDYGENLLEKSLKGEAEEPKEIRPTGSKSPSSLEPHNWLMASGDSIEGYRIESHFKPISVGFPLVVDGEDPLGAAYAMLWKRTQQLGANALIQVKWVTSSDLRVVVMSGLPVFVKPGTGR